MTKFVPKIEKKCDTHFKKECDITYKEEVETQNMKVCTKKPQRKCDLTDEEKAIFNVTETSHMECRTHYETGTYILWTNIPVHFGEHERSTFMFQFVKRLTNKKMFLKMNRYAKINSRKCVTKMGIIASTTDEKYAPPLKSVV